MPLTQAQLNNDLLTIKVLHGRLGDDYAKSLAYYTGNRWYLNHLFRKCLLIGYYLEALERYNADGSDETENIITNSDVESIIDASYRELEEWNT
jgi:hypothetical protein